MSNVISECWLTIEFTETVRIDQGMKGKIMMLHKEFVNESVDRDFTIH